MGLFDRWGRSAEPVAGGQDADAQAIARYRYLLRTAPPETLEAAHAEAFAQLTPEQRRQVLADVAAATPAAERAAVERAGDEPGALARAATRAELRQPGLMERVLGRSGPAAGAAPGGVGMGGLMAGTLLSSLAGTVLGSLVAQQFLAHHPPAGLFDGAEHDRDTAGTIDNPWTEASDGRSADLGLGATDDPIDVDGGGFDGGGFDGGSFDV